MTRMTEGAGWIIRECEPHVRLRLKQMFPRIPRTAEPPYRLLGGPIMAADLLWFTSRYPFRMTDEDRAALVCDKDLFDQGQAELADILTPDWAPTTLACDFRDGQRPFNYQMQAVELTRRMGRLLVVDELGLGKTITGLATIADRQYLPCLIAAPIHLCSQWHEKIEEFTHFRAHTMRQGAPYHLPRADIYLCPYSRLSRWVDYARRGHFKSVICEEMHELRKGTDSQKGQAANIFLRSARLIQGLTATPIYNYGDEIFNIIDLLAPGALGSWPDFSREWCSPIGSNYKVDDPQALGTYLRENFLMLRRTRTDVGHERKFANVITHKVPFDQQVLAADDAMMRQLATTVIHGAFTDRGQASREFDMRLRHATGVAKAPHVAAFCKIILQAGHPIILGGWHRDVYEIWLRELRDFAPVMYTGSETPKHKDLAKKRFIAGDAGVMIMSLRSGAGVDGLQMRSHIVVHGELDWSPEVHAQLTGRLDRPKQTEQVDSIFLITDGGSDPAVGSVLGLKASQSHGIIDPTVEPRVQQNDGQRIRALAQAYLDRRTIIPVVTSPLITATAPRQGRLMLT